jgi:hypothetical protein
MKVYTSLLAPSKPRSYQAMSDIPDDFKRGVNSTVSEVKIRMSFLRKVYAILTM